MGEFASHCVPVSTLAAIFAALLQNKEIFDQGWYTHGGQYSLWSSMMRGRAVW
jgi:hypothetical protein